MSRPPELEPTEILQTNICNRPWSVDDQLQDAACAGCFLSHHAMPIFETHWNGMVGRPEFTEITNFDHGAN